MKIILEKARLIKFNAEREKLFMNTVNIELDVKGLNCPLPILRAKKALASMESGQTLRVVATDPGAVKDFAAFCKQTGNPLVSSTESASEFTFLISKR
jgi:tRNA 2-thiouridine synthesizing protein A